MKKIILFLFIYLFLTADDYEIKLYKTVFSNIFNSNKVKVLIKSNNKKILKVDMFNIVSSCKDADILIGNFIDLPKKCQNKPIFALSYKEYKTQKNIIGAFYWRKGRPQLIFRKDNIIKYKINLSDELMRYAK